MCSISTGSQRRFEILAAVVAQAEVQAFSGRGLLDYVLRAVRVGCGLPSE